MNALNELYANFEKICLKNKALQKQLDLLSNELEVLRSKNEYLLASNKELSKEKVLEEFELKSSNSALNEKSILKREISNTYDHEIGVQDFNSQRANVKSSSLHNSHDIKCFYCCKLGHIAYNCPLKRKSYYGPKMKWIPKETKPSNVFHANP